MDPQLVAMYPELKALPPLTPGMPQIRSVLGRMRKSQLIDLARAFGVESQIDVDGTREAILPVMLALEDRGTFRGKPVRVRALVRASYTQDAWQYLRKSGRPLPDEGLPADPEPEVHNQVLQDEPDSYAGLQKRCKDLNINCFHKGREWMLAALKARSVGVEYDNKTAEQIMAEVAKKSLGLGA